MSTESDGETRVILVDDKPLNRRVMQLILAHFGGDVTAVSSVDAALAALASRSADLVFVDLDSDRTDGLRAIETLRSASLEPRPALVAVGSDRGGAFADEARAAGADAFLRAPVDAGAVRALLDLPNAENTDARAGGAARIAE